MSKTTKKDCMSNHLLLMKLILYNICLFTAVRALYCEAFWSIYVWCMVEVRD